MEDNDRNGSKRHLSITVDNEHSVGISIGFHNHIEWLNPVEVLGVRSSRVGRLVSGQHPPCQVAAEVVLNSLF